MDPFQVGQKKAREMWFLARFYSAEEADKMGLVNKVVPVSSRLLCPSFMQYLAVLLLNFQHLELKRIMVQ